MHFKMQIKSADVDSDKKINAILGAAEKIRKMAEIEADRIIEDALRKATTIKLNAFLENGGLAATEKKQQDITGEKHSGKFAHDRHGLCAATVFSKILESERSRADRNGHELSLVIFNIHAVKHNKLVGEFVKILKTRVRTIDRFGWYDEIKIGVVLPNTGNRGGMKFAHDVCERMIDKKLLPPDFKVYTYPSRWLARRNFNEKRSTGSNNYLDDKDPIFVKTIPIWKRIIDIVGSSLTIILLSPLFIIIPLVIVVVSPGPVFFKQIRVGLGGKLFTFFKFRTMYIKNDPTLHEFYLKDLINADKPMTKLDRSDDPRIIPLGKFLRKASIDEIPQLFNVLKGDMSLVGPRPCLPNEAKEYLKWHMYRFDINPGMTGLWQVSGKNYLTFKKMIRLDIMYSKKMSITMDLGILFLTIPVVISMIIDKFSIDIFFNKFEKKAIPEEQFKEFIKKYYADIYNVDKLEFLEDKLKKYHVNLTHLVLLLAKLHKLSPTYNVAKRYFGICRLIDFEKKSQSIQMSKENIKR